MSLDREWTQVIIKEALGGGLLQEVFSFRTTLIKIPFPAEIMWLLLYMM